MKETPAQKKSHRASIIETSLANFKLRSPTMLASGVLGISFDLFPRIIRSGCGAVVTKSIGTEPREGYPNPTMTATDCGYLNAIGLANPGVKVFRQEFEEWQQNKSNIDDVPIIVSIFADSAENFGNIAFELDDFEFLAFELNLSCPHVKEVGSEIGSDPNDAAEIVRQVKRKTKKPVFAKMPASLPKVPDWARTVESAGADAIVAINTLRAMKIDIESRTPVLSNRVGGLSGSAIRPVAVRCVYEAFDSVKIPIIGVGGVSTWQDTLEFILAGARAVQVGSAMATGYLETFGEINRGLERYIEKNNFSKLDELVGLAHN